MSSKRPRRLGVTIVVIAVAIAACGGSGTDTTSAGSATVVTTVSSATASTSTTTSMPTTTTTTTLPTTTVTTEGSSGVRSVFVFYGTGDGSDCSQVTGFEREIETGLDPHLMAFSLLVGGPTEREAVDGAHSQFSESTAGSLRGLSLDDGYLVVEFSDVRKELANASSSCGSEALLAELNSTAFQFREVRRVRYEIENSCTTFGEWLQRECEEYTRDGAVPPLTTNERASGSGCTPGSAELPEGRWFGFVTDTEASRIVFDLACWFSGSAAIDAAAEDGEESPPPNDYYIRNANDQLRTIPVSAVAEVTWLGNVGDPASAETIPYRQWIELRAGRGEYQPGVWIEIDDGAVETVEEQYVP